MEKLFAKTVHPYYETETVELFCEDCMRALSKMRAGSVDMIFADPPYFLSNGGISCKGGKMVSVNKAAWDEGKSQKERHQFNRRWIRSCKRVLKPGGTIWISGTLHNIYSIGMALEQEGFRILNNITWEKTNPPPNLACRCFTHSTETVLWAEKPDKKAKHYFDYAAMKAMNQGKQMKDVWRGSLTKASEKVNGGHPTQKPEYLLERIVLASTREGELVLDPFCGSGTTGVAATRLQRRFIGIDNVSEYLDMAIERLERQSAANP